MIVERFAGLTLATAENRQLTLEDAKRRVKWQHAVIEFSYKFSSSVAALEETMEQASTGIDALRLAPDSVQQAATAIESLPEVVDSFKPSLDILLKNVGTLVQFVDGMAQVSQKPRILSPAGTLSARPDSSIRKRGVEPVVGSTQGWRFID